MFNNFFNMVKKKNEENTHNFDEILSNLKKEEKSNTDKQPEIDLSYKVDSVHEGWGDMDNVVVEDEAVNVTNEKNQSLMSNKLELSNH